MRMLVASLGLLLASLGLPEVSAQLNGLRLCVPESIASECQSMKTTVGHSKVQCVTAKDKIACMGMVRSDQADLVKASAEDIYTAGYEYGLAPFVMEEVARAPYEYRSAAVVQRSSPIRSLKNLRGKRACMDRCVGPGPKGYRSADTGWHIPLAALLDRRVMEPDCRGQDYTLANFFSGACAPGPWSSSSVVDQMLKKEFPNLCSQCQDPESCTSAVTAEAPSGVCGPATALDCLAEGRGDVAFVDPQDVTVFLQRRPDQRGNMELLCLDGTRRPLREAHDGSGPGCVWNQRPTDVFMGDSDKVHLRYSFVRSLRQIFQNYRVRPPSWFHKVLVSSGPEAVTDLLPVQDQRDSWNTYLAGYRVPLEKELPNCETRQLRLCVWTKEEENKCEEWSRAAFPRRIRPRLRCEKRNDAQDCVEAVMHRHADMLVLPAGEAYKQARAGHLRLMASEVVEDSGPEEEGYGGDRFRGAFSVAVVKRTGKLQTLDDLKGKRSCHSGIHELASWAMPISVLLETGALNELDCDRSEAMTRFFSAGSCVPGAANGSSLCLQCRGADDAAFSYGKDICDSEIDRYAGDLGALRCLLEGSGDVAFMRHWAVQQLLNWSSGRRQYSIPRWAQRLRTQDLALLCPPSEENQDQLQSLNKDKLGLASLAEYRRCNWGRVPPSFVLISSEASEETQLDAAQFLSESARIFAKGTDSDLTFKLFGGSFYNSSADQLFFEGASTLEILPFKASYREAIEPKVLQIVEAADSEQCSERLRDGSTSTGAALWLLVTVLIGLRVVA